MKLVHLVSAVTTSVLLFTSNPALSLAQDSHTSIANLSDSTNEKKSSNPTDLAINAFLNSKDKITKLPIQCLYFVEYGPVDGESDMDINVREKHNEICGGDPDVDISVAFLRVYLEKVYILDMPSGEYLPLD